MPDEGKLSEEMARGAHAQRLLDDEMFKEAMATVAAGYQDAWRRSKPDQTSEREMLWLALRVLDDIKAKITQVVNTGRLAAEQIRINEAQ